MKIKGLLYFSIASALTCSTVKAQLPGGFGVHGNFEINTQYYNPDSAIGAPVVPEKLLSNGFSNLTFTYGKFNAGLRYESYLNALQGFDPRYTGSGITYRYAQYTVEELEITVGNFYDQFGNGLIFRSYEERSLGYDNAMDGIRLRYNPVAGIYLKGFIAKQRSYFTTGPGIVRGIDGEFNVNELVKSLSDKKTRVIVGGSFVSKYQKDEDPVYNLPENVGAYAVRMNLMHGGFSLNGEYAYRYNDPSTVNNNIYKYGDAIYLQLVYAGNGLGVTLTGKRIDNMNYRSDRTAVLQDLNINYLPALPKTQTYRLATIYPYATQPNGEQGIDGEIFYTFSKGSALGGKYGTSVNINCSALNSIYMTPAENDTLGYETDYFRMGEDVYYRDINIEVTKKLTKKWKAILTYINQVYNKAVVEGKLGVPIVHDNIGIADITYKIDSRNSIRCELQHLWTKQDHKNWAMGLLEYTFSPNWSFTVYDEYNYGNDEKEQRIHYLNAALGYSKKANRIFLGYGRQREGLLCVGGVCRNVPAANGFTLTITSSF
jgi:hypothetical protein